MQRAYTTTALLSLISSVSAFIPINPYQLTYDYSGQNFFNNFRFYDEADPTHGFVEYVSQSVANNTGLAGFISDPAYNSTILPVYLGVDSTTQNPANGRASTRVNSVQTFDHALVVADILHMPAPICGQWGAYWLLGSRTNWPYSGEIDILEGVNTGTANAMTLHTGTELDIMNMTTWGQRGTLTTPNCNVNDPSQPKNAGCSVVDHNTTLSYGKAFNDNSGGVFATLIDSQGVSIWFFDRQHIPADISSGSPAPPLMTMNTTGGGTAWGLPNARFMTLNGTQKFDEKFMDLQIIFNTALCGEWAGSDEVWRANAECSALAPTCKDYVANTPSAFVDAYWAIQSVKVYQKTLGGAGMKSDAGVSSAAAGTGSIFSTGTGTTAGVAASATSDSNHYKGPGRWMKGPFWSAWKNSFGKDW